MAMLFTPSGDVGAHGDHAERSYHNDVCHI
jgi:hypothetical protein